MIFRIFKVEKILEGSLDLISSPSGSVKNSNYWRESLFEVYRQKIVVGCQQTFCFQKFVDKAQQCFAFIPQTNFNTNKLNFH